MQIEELVSSKVFAVRQHGLIDGIFLIFLTKETPFTAYSESLAQHTGGEK